MVGGRAQDGGRPGLHYAVSLGGGLMGLILKFLYDSSFTNRNYIYTLYMMYVNIVYNPSIYIKG